MQPSLHQMPDVARHGRSHAGADGQSPSASPLRRLATSHEKWAACEAERDAPSAFIDPASVPVETACTGGRKQVWARLYEVAL